MEELLYTLAGIAGVFLIGAIKPEWILKPLLKMLSNKLPKISNKFGNSFGLMFQEMAIYSIEYEPDDPEMVKILESMKKAKDELEAYIKKSSN
jgi:hypothetical protein